MQWLLLVWSVCSLDQYASNGSQSAGAPGRYQVHSAVRDGFLPGVQRDTDTADDWTCWQTTGLSLTIILVLFYDTALTVDLDALFISSFTVFLLATLTIQRSFGLSLHPTTTRYLVFHFITFAA